VTAATDSPCAHCGLDASGGAACVDGARSFCCAGCRAAWRLIHDAGLERFYAFAERVAPSPDAADAAPGRYGEYDHPAFTALHTRALGDGLREVELYVEGVHCASCVWLIERLPLIVPGAVRAELDLPRARVRVVYDPAGEPLSAIARALATLGYRPHPYRSASRESRRRAEDRAILARIGLAGALAGNVMLVAVALYAGWFGHIEPEYEAYFRWISLLLTAPAILGPGRVFFSSASPAARSTPCAAAGRSTSTAWPCSSSCSSSAASCSSGRSGRPPTRRNCSPRWRRARPASSPPTARCARCRARPCCPA
jgi:Cu2+-exporting ATPase